MQINWYTYYTLDYNQNNKYSKYVLYTNIMNFYVLNIIGIIMSSDTNIYTQSYIYADTVIMCMW